MPNTPADPDPVPAEVQVEDTAENKPKPVETHDEPSPETGSIAVEAEESLPGEDAESAQGEGPAVPGSDLEGATSDGAASDPGFHHDTREAEAEEKKRRRRLLGLLAVLLLALSGTVALFFRYVTRPAPLPDLLPVPVDVNYAPHYLFSIYGADKPVGVALSPQGDRLYVAEGGGEREVKIFGREGNPLGSFAPPRTQAAERSPVYLTTDDRGRVFVADRLQHALFVYDQQGQYLDTILSPDLTLSEYVSEQTAGLVSGTAFAYDTFEAAVYYHQAGEAEQLLPAPEASGWSPLGIRIDDTGRMLITDVSTGNHSVHQISGDVLLAASWDTFDPLDNAFGADGNESGQFLFPNVAVIDSLGRIHVTDGNNGRISVWNDRGEFLFEFGWGAGEGALNLPRGADIDERDRLHVVDAVGQTVRVYDVSKAEPSFLFTFGYWGSGDGQFNYPNDIVLDTTGRLYIADRENNRVQVWSY